MRTAAAIPCAPPPPSRGIVPLQVVTLGWMLLECGVALSGAAAAQSPALLAFGADSLVELLSALVVLLQFVPRFRLRPAVAARWAGVPLFVLAGVVALTALAGLLRGAAPDPSRAGILITAAALVVMPALAWQKRRLAARTGNRALRADAAQSATCAYLAALTLLALAINARFHLPWIDPAAALLALPLLILEGRRALAGEPCGCC